MDILAQPQANIISQISQFKLQNTYPVVQSTNRNNLPPLQRNPSHMLFFQPKKKE